MSSLGIVVIGRNEGARLDRTLRATLAAGVPVVYADSGSEDDSIAVAEALGVQVAHVSPTPDGIRSAARGRNVGLAALRAAHPELRWVQFVDGDTELHPEWLGAASAELHTDASIGTVCGELAELDADQNVYRLLLGMEWRGPIGDIDACGGNAMYRLAVFDAVDGFQESLVGGEEADLCGRIRAAGSRIVRLPAAMGTHDSGIATLGAWWMRAARVGDSLIGIVRDPSAHDDRVARRALASGAFWGLFVPGAGLVSLAAGLAVPEIAIATPLLALAYGIQILRITAHAARSGLPLGAALHYGIFCMLGKTALVHGATRAILHRRA